MDIFIQLMKDSALLNMTWKHLAMILICLLILYLAIKHKFEPLLLLPIGFAGLLANIPMAGLAETVGSSTGALKVLADFGLNSQYGTLFPLFIFLGVGAMTDFGPMLANPKTLLLGAAAQVGIFITFFGAIALGFDLHEAGAIAIIGGADGPTAIYLSNQLADHLLGPIAISAYSYMALVPLIQPPIARMLTSKNERKIRMIQLREVSKREKILFPILLVLLVSMFLPTATPLVGMFALGNLMKESMVVDRLSHTSQNALINIVTIMLGLAVGSKLEAGSFLTVSTLSILLLGIIAFALGTAGGVLMAKFMNIIFKHKTNPLIGAAGVSAVPMAARVVNKLGLEEDDQNFLLMHAMGPNVAGVIGSTVAAGIFLSALL